MELNNVLILLFIEQPSLTQQPKISLWNKCPNRLFRSEKPDNKTTMSKNLGGNSSSFLEIRPKPHKLKHNLFATFTFVYRLPPGSTGHTGNALGLQ